LSRTKILAPVVSSMLLLSMMTPLPLSDIQDIHQAIHNSDIHQSIHQAVHQFLPMGNPTV
jgi:hypothetical protein